MEKPTGMLQPRLFEFPEGWILLIGDCVNLSDLDLSITSNSALMRSVSRLNGNFHLFYFNSVESRFYAYNSLWGMSPLYFTKTTDELLFSGSLSLLKRHSGSTPLNKKYLLQSILFNYSLCDDTFWLNISVLPVNSFMKVGSDLTHTCSRYFNIEDYFVSDPLSGKEKLNYLSDLFISETAGWFPEERFAISFTGGFDGRTLVSVANSFNKDFFTYSFGNSDSTDLLFPKEQSKLLGLDFTEILLDRRYAEGYYREHFMDIVFNSDGMAGVNRSHYNFAAERLSKQTRYILTGNFGSEILRSLHVTGALFSGAMYHVFNHAENNKWIDKIMVLPEFQLLNMQEFRNDWEETISDVTKFVESNNRSEKNLWLYKFVMEDVLRKYFGPEIVMQTNYVVNRTPFLNITFIRELLKTKYAGAYGPFFTDNPILRFKGQEVYAHIIKKTSTDLFLLPTNKGYRPSDILSLTGKLHLISNFIRKRLKVNDTIDRDPFGVSAAVDVNLEFILKCLSENPFVNSNLIGYELIQNKDEGRNRSLRILSYLQYISVGVNGKS